MGLATTQAQQAYFKGRNLGIQVMGMEDMEITISNSTTNNWKKIKKEEVNMCNTLATYATEIIFLG